TMTGRERVNAALTFSSPDRAPRDLWVLPYSSMFRGDEIDDFLERYPLDFDRIELYPEALTEQQAQLAKPGTYTDDWGSVWQVGVPGTIGEVQKPAVADWSDLPRFQPPWHLIRDRNLDFFNRSCDTTSRFTLTPVSARPFERIQFLRGPENVYLDLAYDSKQFRSLLELVHSFYLEEIEMWASTNVDAVFMMDDWGTQEAMLISPTMWRSIFKPLYKKYCDIIHGAGKFAFFHSDGHIEAIYNDLIEVGMDAINSQLFCMDIEGLASKYKGRVTFWGEIDRQQVLPFGTTGEVRQAVARVRSALDDGVGGVIAQCEWGKDNETDNIEAVFDAWL
ncbi:MAG: uroporphyrinogen decarboxylase family protein, partial [Rhodothermia bacterium]